MASKAKNTTALLQRLRQLMKNKKYVPEPLHAYIIPSGDAHQVSTMLVRCVVIGGYMS